MHAACVAVRQAFGAAVARVNATLQVCPVAARARRTLAGQVPAGTNPMVALPASVPITVRLYSVRASPWLLFVSVIVVFLPTAFDFDWRFLVFTPPSFIEVSESAVDLAVRGSADVRWSQQWWRVDTIPNAAQH